MENRINKIVDSMTSFNRDKYTNCEVLTELFKLQDELVKQTFNDKHADAAELRIWDVENYLEKMNENLDYVADEELRVFKNGCKFICNEIKARISGNRGESKAFFNLENLPVKNVLMKNLELENGDLRSEIDALVVTRQAIYIVEVKNPHKDIFISEEGLYYKTGEFLRLDCNIGEKMDLRESLVRANLVKNGIAGKPIKKVIVFTNDRISVQNKYKDITICFLSQLKHIVSDERTDICITDDEMQGIKNVLEKANIDGKYSFDFDVNGFKRSYAELLVKLEEANSNNQTETSTNDYSFVDKVKQFVQDKSVQKTGKTVAVASIATVIVMSLFSKGGH